ncbi:MAG: hypothetical protein ACFFAM_20535, partial [Promethearchaeota archaeon]
SELVQLIYLTGPLAGDGVCGRKLTGFRTNNNDLAVIFTSNTMLKLLFYSENYQELIDLRHDMAGFAVDASDSLIDDEGNFHLLFHSNTLPISIYDLIIDQSLNYQMNNFFNYSSKISSFSKLKAISYNNRNQEVLSCIDLRSNESHYNIHLFSPENEDTILTSFNYTLHHNPSFYAQKINEILRIVIDSKFHSSASKIKTLQILDYNISNWILKENKTHTFDKDFEYALKFDPTNLSYMYYIPTAQVEGAASTEIHLRFFDDFQNEKKLTFPVPIHEESQLLIAKNNYTQLITRIPYNRQLSCKILALYEGNFNLNNWILVKNGSSYPSTHQISDFLGIGRILSTNKSSLDLIYTTNGFPSKIIEKYTINQIKEPRITDGTGIIFIGKNLAENSAIVLDGVDRTSIRETEEYLVLLGIILITSTLILGTIKLIRKRN